MSIERTISTRTILNSLSHLLNLDSELRVVAIREWCSEALEFIGVGSNYVVKECILDVKEYKAPLPCGYKNFKFLFKGTTTTCEAMLYSNTVRIRPQENRFSNEFTIRENKIYTNFRVGKILLVYDSLEVDDEGYPMMPDDIRFAYACQWFCIRNLIMSGYAMAVPEINYTFADEKWLDYCSQAAAFYQFPNVAEMQSIANNFQRLIPQRGRYDDGFANLNKPERGRLGM